MANFVRVLRNLRHERNHAQRELDRLDQAISVLEGLSGRDHIGRPRGPGRLRQARRRLSAAARARIAAAQRARWAKLKQKKAKAGK
jgi:hypothetical protein